MTVTECTDLIPKLCPMQTSSSPFFVYFLNSLAKVANFGIKNRSVYVQYILHALLITTACILLYISTSGSIPLYLILATFSWTCPSVQCELLWTSYCQWLCRSRGLTFWQCFSVWGCDWLRHNGFMNSGCSSTSHINTASVQRGIISVINMVQTEEHMLFILHTNEVFPFCCIWRGSAIERGSRPPLSPAS